MSREGRGNRFLPSRLYITSTNTPTLVIFLGVFIMTTTKTFIMKILQTPQFGRGRRARREDTATGISDGGRPSSVTRPRRGLFRRRRGRNDRVGEEPRRWRRPAPGVGMSLSDTESRHLRADVSAGRRVSGTRISVADREAIENGQTIDRSYHGVTRGNSTGGGGGSGEASAREAFLYAAPQPLHRYRTNGHAEEEYRLSQDPDFPPPIPYGGGEETGAPSSRGDAFRFIKGEVVYS